jgi:hypothetical protein
LFATVISVSANLTPASGRQDHTTSPSASAPFVEPCWPRPPHPAHVRDDRETPLWGWDRIAIFLFLPNREAKNFCKQG